MKKSTLLALILIALIFIILLISCNPNKENYKRYRDRHQITINKRV